MYRPRRYLSARTDKESVLADEDFVSVTPNPHITTVFLQQHYQELPHGDIIYHWCTTNTVRWLIQLSMCPYFRIVLLHDCLNSHIPLSHVRDAAASTASHVCIYAYIYYRPVQCIMHTHTTNKPLTRSSGATLTSPPPLPRPPAASAPAQTTRSASIPVAIGTGCAQVTQIRAVPSVVPAAVITSTTPWMHCSYLIVESYT